MPFVYDFDHTHRRPPMEMKDLLGGKGANLAEMTSVLGLPGARTASPSPPTPAGPTWHGGWPDGPDRRGQAGPGPAREEDGQAPRRPRRPAARERPLGGQVLHARDDGHRPQPRASTTSRCVGLAKQTDDERFAYDSYRRFVAMYGRIVLGIAGEAFDTLLDEAKERCRRRHRRRRPGRAAAQSLVDAYKTDRHEPHRGRLPPGPRRPAAGRDRGRVRVVERAPGHRLPRPRGHRPRPRHGRQRPGHGVRQPRRPVGHRRRVHPRPGHRRQGRVRRLPRQRPGRGRRGRHPQHRAPVRPEGQVPQDPRRAAGHLRPPRAALPRHVRHRVHHRAGQALDAADPGGQAHRARRAAHGRRDDQGRRHPPHPGRGRAAGDGRAPRAGAPPPVRRRRATTCSPRAWAPRPGRPWAGPTSPPTTPPRRPSGESRSSSSAARPRPRTSTACSPPRGSSPPGAASCPTPRSWPGAGASRPWSAPRRSASRAGPSRWGPPSSEGDWLSIDGTAGEVVLGQVDAGRGRGIRRSSTRSSAGPTRSARATSGCGPTPTPVPTPPTPGARGRGHRAVPDRAHVHRRGPPPHRAPHDPGRRHRRRRTPRWRSCAWPSGPTSSRSSRPWTGFPSPCACSTRPCTNSFPTRATWPSRRPPSG